MRSRSRRSREVNTEINITAFMNLMVVLVPFLLLTAVFSQISILELNLPPAQNQQPLDEPKKPIVLEVTIYKNRIVLSDKQTGPIRIIPNKSPGPNPNKNKSLNKNELSQLASYDFSALKQALVMVKGKFPETTDVTILLEEDTPYDLLIKTMDTVRLYSETKEGETIQYELFPDIAIGNAPQSAANLTNVDSGIAITFQTISLFKLQATSHQEALT
ncbi:MAG: biopolymer transporter ExbD [Pseudomonadales bacterium]|nr:biopolymer transporter ExbD [Pseudomonadales bacterium]